MNRFVLREVTFNQASLYSDLALKALKCQKEEALSSPQLLWAKANRCKINVTTVVDPSTGDGSIVWYAALSEVQQTEFALRF